MGLFDRWTKKPRAASRPHATAEPDRGEATPTAQVPEGHKVQIVRPTPTPHVTRTPGGVVVADVGLGGDELPDVLDELLRAVETTTATGSKPVHVAHHHGVISELFAPGDPQVVSCPGLVVWILHAGSLGDWLDEPARLQELLRRVYRLGARRDAPVVQQAYLVDHTSSHARLALEMLAGLGIAARAPEKDGSTLVEIHRPEGIVIAALAGRALEAKDVDPYPRTVNEEKDRAESEGDRDRLRQIEEHERAFLAKRIVEIGPDRKKEPLTRAPRLCRLLLDVSTTDGEAAWQALNEELLSRDFPLVLMADPATKGVAPRAWKGAGKAIPAYPDLISLNWTAADLKMAAGSFALALMPPRTLLDWAAKLDVGIAMNVYRDRSSPLYVMLPPERVQALAEAGRRRK